MKLIYIITAIGLLSSCSLFKHKKKAAPKQTLDSKCYEKADPGMCRAYKPRYYYDTTDGKCKQFIWGGCGGNVPFNTLIECQKKCGCDTSAE